MLLSVILFMLSVPGDANDVTRDFFGDIFRMRDCHNGSRCDNGGRRPALQVPGRPCYCQCAPSHLAYREDKQQCVKDIKECYMSVFYRPFTVEAIPLVYLPTSGQLVHPDAHLSLSMRRNFENGLAKCRVTVSQYLTKEGWRTITKTDGTGGSVFGLFTDSNKTYLQFLGSPQDRKLLQQHMILIRLLCVIPDYPAFETCVAIRIGWVPGIENVDVPSPSNKANMMVVGLSLGILALVYIFAVLVYLKIRRQMIAKQKANTDQEAKLQSRDDNSEKTSTLRRMESSNRLELYHTASLGRIKPSKKGYRNNSDPWNQMSPIIETYNRTWTDRMGQHSSEFRAQDFKLQPEFFEPEFMASPPHEVLEYLERLQNSITFARHRMRSCYRYQPTLNGIPEDDYFYQELEKKDPQTKDIRTTPDGGSASSVGSLQESFEEKNDVEQKELPKVPPRKPKRKIMKDKPENPSANPQNSDLEQKEIQNAMNTLNDTLDALEFDMYKQEVLTQTSDTETGNLSCQNSTSIDFDDLETSSCSSTSAVTILSRDAKRYSDISKGSLYMEKNQSEDISTFSNSTFSLCETMQGLFHDGNKVSSNFESEKSNFSSRCSSRTGYASQAEEHPNAGLEKTQKMTNSNSDINPMKQSLSNCNSNCNENEEKRYNTFRRKQAYFNGSNEDYSQRNLSSTNHFKRLQGNTQSSKFEENVYKRTKTPDKDNENSRRNTPIYETRQNHLGTPNEEMQHKSFKNKHQLQNSHNKTMSSNNKNIRNSKSPNPEVTNNISNKSSKNRDNVEKSKEKPKYGENRIQNSKSPNATDAETVNITENFVQISDRNNETPKLSINCDKRNFGTKNSAQILYRNSKSPNPSNAENRNIETPNPEEVRYFNSKSPQLLEKEHLSSDMPTNKNVHDESLPNVQERKHSPKEQIYGSINHKHNKFHRNVRSPDSENSSVRTKTPNENHPTDNNLKNSLPNLRNLNEEIENKTSDSESLYHTLRKSNSTESMNTIATDMTVDSLDSRCPTPSHTSPTPSHPSPTPSLMEMWINKLVSTSVPYSKNRRKSKKKLILPEDEVNNWEHVCQKHKDTCPNHDLNDSEPNLIDKLAHYSSKTMAGCDVAGYFQSLKQDVLKEHLKQWLSSNNQSKKHKKGFSLEYNNECSHKKPLVNGQETTLVDDTGMHLSNNNCSIKESNHIEKETHDVSIMVDSLESNSSQKLKENGNVYFGENTNINELSVKT